MMLIVFFAALWAALFEPLWLALRSKKGNPS